MSHPPLCPKTPERFVTDNGAIEVCVDDDPILSMRYFSDRIPDRRFVARYQACAWQDRSKRWQALAEGYHARWVLGGQWPAVYRSSRFHNKYSETGIIAKAWREWENSGEA